jgi:hypothetical protein
LAWVHFSTWWVEAQTYWMHWYKRWLSLNWLTHMARSCFVDKKISCDRTFCIRCTYQQPSDRWWSILTIPFWPGWELFIFAHVSKPADRHDSSRSFGLRRCRFHGIYYCLSER